MIRRSYEKKLLQHMCHARHFNKSNDIRWFSETKCNKEMLKLILDEPI